MNFDRKVKELYYDWNLKEKSGMLLIVLESNAISKIAGSYKGKSNVQREISEVSKRAEKSPEEVHSVMLNNNTLLIYRKGFMVSIEKELVELGHQEVLKTTKRNLEKRILSEHKRNLEKHLNSQLVDYFVDWNFQIDESYIILIIKENKAQKTA